MLLFLTLTITSYDQLQPFAGAYHSMFSRDIDLYALFKSNRKYSDEVFVSSLVEKSPWKRCIFIASAVVWRILV